MIRKKQIRDAIDERLLASLFAVDDEEEEVAIIARDRRERPLVLLDAAATKSVTPKA